MRERIFLKVVQTGRTHNDIEYKTGIVTDPNFVEHHNGIYFCTPDNILEWLSFGDSIAYITIPKESKKPHRVYTGVFFTDMINISEIVPIDLSTLKFHYDIATDKTLAIYQILIWGYQHNQAEIIKFAYSKGAKFKSRKEEILFCQKYKEEINNGK